MKVWVISTSEANHGGSVHYVKESREAGIAAAKDLMHDFANEDYTVKNWQIVANQPLLLIWVDGRERVRITCEEFEVGK